MKAGPHPDDLASLTGKPFREEYGHLVSILTARFGTSHFHRIEDAVQEAFVKALETWPYYGRPEHPRRWLLRTAGNRMIDLLRRDDNLGTKLRQLQPPTESAPEDFSGELRDDTLRLLFICCHPEIRPDERILLALKTLGGFSVTEIARTFLTQESAIAKRLTRAKERVRCLRLPFEIPPVESLRDRIESVIRVVSLIFAEGHTATLGESLTRPDLCDEAIRLARLLLTFPHPDHPTVHALLAGFLLHRARLHTRTDPRGNLLTLAEQDRGLWNTGMIHEGLLHLDLSRQGAITAYHLQAGILALHVTAPGDQATPWPKILHHYDLWMRLKPSPLVAINRLIALSRVEGHETAIRQLLELEPRELLDRTPFYHATLGDLYERLDRHQLAAKHFRLAASLTLNPVEKRHLLNRIAPDHIPLPGL